MGSLDTDRLSEQLEPYPPALRPVMKFFTNLYRDLCCSHAYT